MEHYYNYMESVVEAIYEEYKGALGCCTCPSCRDDVIAYTLNRLPPKYIVSSPGAAFTRLDALQTQYRADVAATLSQAAAVVAKSPRH